MDVPVMTDDHPFFVIGKGWKQTIELKVGDKIETDGNGAMEVVSVIDEQRLDLTYNFTVADFHTYYVTERNLLVHNCGKTKKLSTGNTVRTEIRNAYEEIRLGNGVPNLDKNGVQKIYQGRENKKWAGATEWLVPGDNGAHHRILKKGDKMGYVEFHDYNNIKAFPAPRYPDGG